MLVDDDRDDQDLFSEALSIVDNSIKLHRADDGEAALDYLHRTTPPPPDFIFLDLNMPKLNGLEFLAAIKKHDSLSNVPVVIYSTSNAAEHRQLTKDIGAAHYMVKQNSFKALCNELASLLKAS